MQQEPQWTLGSLSRWVWGVDSVSECTIQSDGGHVLFWSPRPRKNKVTTLNHVSYLNHTNHQTLFQNLPRVTRFWDPCHQTLTPLTQFSVILYWVTYNDHTWNFIFKITFYCGKIHIKSLFFPCSFLGLKNIISSKSLFFFMAVNNT